MRYLLVFITFIVYLSANDIFKLDYKYNDLHYYKTINNKIPNGDYNVSVVYYPKTISRDVKYIYKEIYAANELMLMPGEEININIKFDDYVDINKYLKMDFLYTNLNPLVKNQNFIKYTFDLEDENNATQTLLFDSHIDKDYDIVSSIDMREALYKDKDKIYLLRRMLGLSFDDKWRLTHIKEREIIQRRFLKKLTNDTIIKIYTNKNSTIKNILFCSNDSNISKIADKVELQESSLKVSNEINQNIYILSIEDILKKYFPDKNYIYLTELQIFLDKFDYGDIQKIDFLQKKPTMIKNIQKYNIEHISSDDIKHEINLKKYLDYKLKSIKINVKNTNKHIIMLKNIKSSLYDSLKAEIPIILNEYLPYEIYSNSYDMIKNIDLDKLIDFNRISKKRDNNITKKVNFDDLNLSSNMYIDRNKYQLALIDIQNTKEPATLKIPMSLGNIDFLDINIDTNDSYKINIDNKNMEILFSDVAFKDKSIILISKLDLNYIDNNLTLKKLLKEDILISADGQKFHLNDINNLFEYNKINFNLNIINKIPDFNITTSKFFKIENVIFTPSHMQAKNTIEDIFSSVSVDSKSSSKANAIFKFLLILLVFIILYKYRKILWIIIKRISILMKEITENIIYSIFKWLKMEKNHILALVYFSVALILYCLFFISNEANISNFSASLAAFFIVITLYYISLVVKSYIFIKYIKLYKVMYRSSGSIYFSWSILLLVVMALCVGLKLFPVANQIAVIIYYLLIWGTLKEAIKMFESNNGQ